LTKLVAGSEQLLLDGEFNPPQSPPTTLQILFKTIMEKPSISGKAGVAGY